MSKQNIDQKILLDYIGNLIDSMSLILKTFMQTQKNQAHIIKSATHPEYIYTQEVSVAPNHTRTVTYTFRILEDNRLELISEQVEDQEL